jgi:hypothetical protein
MYINIYVHIQYLYICIYTYIYVHVDGYVNRLKDASAQVHQPRRVERERKREVETHKLQVRYINHGATGDACNCVMFGDDESRIVIFTLTHISEGDQVAIFVLLD